MNKTVQLAMEQRMLEERKGCILGGWFGMDRVVSEHRREY